jgi:hypothetical protein
MVTSILTNLSNSAKEGIMSNPPDKDTALRIINSLKDGVPSVDDIEYFSVSGNPLDTIIAKDMDEIYRGNYGKIKFINGGYGEGKTHFLSRIRAKAINEGFPVSMFAISPRGIALDMMERTFGELTKTLVAKDMPENYKDGRTIEYLVSKWAQTVEDPERTLRDMPLADRDIRNVLLHMSKLIMQREQNFGKLDLLNGWLLGNTHNKADLKKYFQVYNHVNPRNVFDILKSLAKFFKVIGYKGLIILIDEQEIVSTLFSSRKRELTDQNIRMLIDDQSKMDGVYILFATTDEFFTHPVKGLVSYPALKTRVTQANTLRLPSIGTAEMKEVALVLKNICEIAWDIGLKVDAEELKSCVKIALDYSIPSGKARTYVKSMIRLMEALRDNKDADPIAIFSEIYPNTYNEVATEKEAALDRIEGM